MLEVQVNLVSLDLASQATQTDLHFLTLGDEIWGGIIDSTQIHNHMKHHVFCIAEIYVRSIKLIVLHDASYKVVYLLHCVSIILGFVHFTFLLPVMHYALCL